MRNQLQVTNYGLRVTRQAVFTLVLCLLWLALAQGICLGATYYVDAVNGDDANPGTVDAPWQTLSKAQSAVVGGDTAILRTGSYSEFIDETTVRTDWITYKADDGHIPILVSIQLGRWDGPFDKYLRFEGLKIEPGEPDTTAITLQRTDHIKIVDCDIVGAGFQAKLDLAYPKSGVYVKGSTDIEVSNCVIHGIGPEPYYDPATGNRYGPGFDMGIFARECQDVNVTDNEIKDCGNAFTLYMGERFNVINNHMYDCIEDLLYIGGTSHVLVENNHIHHGIQPEGSQAHVDCLQIGTPYEDHIPHDITVRGNKMHHSSGQVVMINYIGEGRGENFTFENNLMYAAEAWCVHVYKTKNLKFVHNTVPSNLLFRIGVEITAMYNNIFEIVDFEGEEANAAKDDYNIINKWWVHVNESNRGGHNLELENIDNFKALFVDYDNDNYRLASDSLAIGFGDPAYAPLTDIEGNPRDASPDAGCYEYTSSTFIYGDVNGNSEITGYDAALVARYAVGLEVFTDEQKQKADVTGNTEITGYDASWIARRAVDPGIVFPVEQP